MKKIERLLFYSLFILLALWSCTKDTIPIDATPIVVGSDFTGVCFESEILPIMVSNCGNTTCHNSIDREEGLDYTTFEGIVKSVNLSKPTESELIEYLRAEEADEIMPPAPQNPLKQAQINLLIQWIEEGAQNTVVCSKLSCENISEVSFSKDVLPILENNCQGCHSTNAASANYAYDTYDQVLKSVNDGSLAGTIQHLPNWDAMPRNRDKMSACEIDHVLIWIGEGALDN